MTWPAHSIPSYRPERCECGEAVSCRAFVDQRGRYIAALGVDGDRHYCPYQCWGCGGQHRDEMAVMRHAVERLCREAAEEEESDERAVRMESPSQRGQLDA